MKLKSPAWFVITLIPLVGFACRFGQGTSSQTAYLTVTPDPVCADPTTDPEGDGLGWENGGSCQVDGSVLPGPSSEVQDQPPPPPTASSMDSNQLYDTTFYPYRGEHYFQTVCGQGEDHGGMYFAVTERSPLWAGSCDNESWTTCDHGDCLGKWADIPSDAKKISGGIKMVREPNCRVPCGQRFKVASQDFNYQTTAVIYDACPEQHWNNRLKEVVEGRNPCQAGSLHVDLRKPLYLLLNGGIEDDNIQVWIDSAPVP